MANRILIAGASGLVGFAALKHFSGLPDWDVLALSRRRPPEVFNARFISADLTDERACAELAGQIRGLTHVVYAALYERAELIAGWRHEEQISVNDRMLRNLFEAVERAAPELKHITLLQGTKAYGVHVRPIALPARENRDEMREQRNFYWLQEDFLKERQRNGGWRWTILRPQIIVGESFGSAMNLIPALGAYAALLKEDGLPLAYPGRAANLNEAVDADLLARAIAWAQRFSGRARRGFQHHQRRRLPVAKRMAGDRGRARHEGGRRRAAFAGARNAEARAGLGSRPGEIWAPLPRAC